MTPFPVPPADLNYRVTGTRDANHFRESGQKSVADFAAALLAIGKSLTDYQNILDFGCGCGRVLLPLKEKVDPAHLTGIDIDEQAIAWARSHLPGVTLHATQPWPPLSFVNGSFDLVICHSVFTHLSERYQDAWLAELHRLTRPGGHLVISLHGAHALRQSLLPEHVHRTFTEHGLAFFTDDNWQGGPFPDFYHTTFHAWWYVQSHWSKFFTIKAYLPRQALNFQDCVVLEHPSTASSAT